jgi:hypothetical protein
LKERRAYLQGLETKTAAQLDEIKRIDNLLGIPWYKRPGRVVAGVSAIVGILTPILFFLIKPPYWDDAADSTGRGMDGECDEDSDFTCTLWNWMNYLDDPNVKLFTGMSSSLCSCCCCCMIILVLVISMEENSSANSYL